MQLAIASPVVCAICMLAAAAAAAAAGVDLDPYDQVGNPHALLTVPVGARVYSTVSPRVISNAVCAAGPTFVEDSRGLNMLLLIYLQLVDHDIVATHSLDTSVYPNASWPIAVPSGDPVFDPSGTGTAVLTFTRAGRAPFNTITSLVDASSVYGSGESGRLEALRDPTGETLRVSGDGKRLLPPNVAGLPVASAGRPLEDMFLAGDVRATENSLLSGLHIVDLREHNNNVNNIGFDFERARQFNIAVKQRVLYNEVLPALLGARYASCARGAPHGVPDGFSARIMNVFASSAFRMHSMLADHFVLASGETIGLGELFFRPEVLRSAPSIEPYIDALYRTAAGASSLRVPDIFRNVLFANQDLAALNIQRGRDTGVPTYNAVRVAFGFAPKASFGEVTGNASLAAALDSLYPGGPSKCDTWACSQIEDHLPGGSLGELNTEIIRRQFCHLRDSDPNFWTRAPYFDDADRAYIAGRTYAHVLCDTVGGRFCSFAGDSVFFVGGSGGGGDGGDDAVKSGLIVLGVLGSIAVLLCMALFCGRR
jgi:peroxidase